MQNTFLQGQDGKRQINHSEKGQSVLEWAEVKSSKKWAQDYFFTKRKNLVEDQSHPLSCCFYVGHNELWLNACMEWCRAVGRRPTLKKCNGKIVPSSQSSYFLSSGWSLPQMSCKQCCNPIPHFKSRLLSQQYGGREECSLLESLENT